MSPFHTEHQSLIVSTILKAGTLFLRREFLEGSACGVTKLCSFEFYSSKLKLCEINITHFFEPLPCGSQGRSRLQHLEVAILESGSQQG